MPEQRWIRSSLVWIVLIVAVLAMWATFVSNDGVANACAASVRSRRRSATARCRQLIQAEGSREVEVEYRQEAGRSNAVTTIPAETDLLDRARELRHRAAESAVRD